MFDTETTHNHLEQGFNQIFETCMQGMPILNNALQVEIIGVQEWEGRPLGLAITPWLMSLVLLPNEEDQWADAELGDKTTHVFPNQDLDFQANDLMGIGPCQTYAIHSPMGKFPDQEAALTAAQEFLDNLMVPATRVNDSIDQQRMDRYLKGEDMAKIRADEEAEKERLAALEAESLEEKMEKPMSRRSLLRGSFLKEQNS